MHVTDQHAHSGGTDNYHRYSALFPSLLITDGVKRLATENSAFWLLDVIGSHLPGINARQEPFLVARLKKGWNQEAIFTFDDGGRGGVDVVLVTQEIDFTDYDFAGYGADEVRLYVIAEEDFEGRFLWTLLLPEEY